MKTNKQIKCAVSFVIYNSEGKMLLVQRPSDDEDLPNAWGLPAGSLKEDESSEQAVVRSGKEKLGITLAVGKMLNEGETERSYTLKMKLFEAKIVSGDPVILPVKAVTQYQSWKWGVANDLKEAASKGSLCCQLFLELTASLQP